MMKRIIQNKMIWLFLILVIITGINVFQSNQKNEVTLDSKPDNSKINNSKSEGKVENNIKIKSKMIMVDVKGAIKKPGVISLEEGKRVYDAINLAGGFQVNADKNQVNLAEILMDEMVIYVPVEGEVLAGPSITSPDQEENDVIDINHATQEELEKIPGVGPSKAKNILEFIEAKGPFTSLEQLEQVNGIGKKSIEQMAPYIVIR